MAKFLQKTLDEMAVQSSDNRSQKAKEFAEFFYRVRTTGTVATNDEIMKFSKLFEDEITLDSLSRQQLIALCRVLDVQTLGTTNFLRFLLRMKLRSLAADDRVSMYTITLICKLYYYLVTKPCYCAHDELYSGRIHLKSDSPCMPMSPIMLK